MYELQDLNGGFGNPQASMTHLVKPLLNYLRKIQSINVCGFLNNVGNSILSICKEWSDYAETTK